MSNIIEIDPRIWELLPQTVAVDRIATGFTFTEGPIWHAKERCLYFSDIPGSKIHRWSESGGTTVHREESRNANGNTLDRRGRLLTCEHSGRRISREESDGQVVTLVDRVNGKRLNSPNDLVVAANGDIYFTDPPYGIIEDGVEVGREIDCNGVYRMTPGEEPVLLVDDFERPNGLVLKAREERLLVADTARGHVRGFNLTPDGVTGGEVHAELRLGDTTGRPDGMKLDGAGNLYIAANTEEGVWIFAPDGELLGCVAVGEPPANLAWGGSDWQTMFITAQTSVYRIRMLQPGVSVGID